MGESNRNSNFTSKIQFITNLKLPLCHKRLEMREKILLACGLSGWSKFIGVNNQRGCSVAKVLFRIYRVIRSIRLGVPQHILIHECSGI